MKEQTTPIAVEDILNDDEIRILKPAVADVRKLGFGEVVLIFRNGYIYRVKVTLDYHNGGDKK